MVKFENIILIVNTFWLKIVLIHLIFIKTLLKFNIVLSVAKITFLIGLNHCLNTKHFIGNAFLICVIIFWGVLSFYALEEKFETNYIKTIVVINWLKYRCCRLIIDSQLNELAIGIKTLTISQIVWICLKIMHQNELKRVYIGDST